MNTAFEIERRAFEIEKRMTEKLKKLLRARNKQIKILLGTVDDLKEELWDVKGCGR